MSERPSVGEGQSLVTLICKLFTSIRSNTTPDSRPMHAAWKETLQIKGRDDADLFDALRWISLAVERLRRQIENSRVLEETARTMCVAVVEGMRQCVRMENIHQSVQQMQHVWSKDQLEKLIIAASVLRLEFPEPTLSSADLDEIRGLLDELQEAVGAAEIPEALKAVLAQHLAFVRWVLDQHQLLGISVVHEATVRAAWAVHRAAGEITVTDDGRNLFQRFMDAFKSIGQKVEDADRKVAAGKRVIQTGYEAIQEFLTYWRG